MPAYSSLSRSPLHSERFQRAVHGLAATHGKKASNKGPLCDNDLGGKPFYFYLLHYKKKKRKHVIHVLAAFTPRVF